MYMVGENLTKFREQKGWTQDKFARKFNAFLNEHGIRDARYNNRTISQWENGQRGPKNTQILTLLAEFMGINVSDMINTEISTFNEISTCEETSASTADQQKIDVKNVFENCFMEAYFATLGIYAYDEEKECFLTRFLWADQYLEQNENTEQYFLSEVCPCLFPSVGTIEGAIDTKISLGCTSETATKSYIYDMCRLNGRFSSRETFDKYWEENDLDYYCSSWMQSYWECFLTESCLNPKNVQAKTSYIDDDVCTVLVEISAELHISKSMYQEFIKEICTGEMSISLNGGNNETLKEISPSFKSITAYYELFRNYNYTI